MIITADWHITDKRPVCRQDDFETALWNKINFIKALQKKYKCPVIHAGDLFEHWKPSPKLLSDTIEYLPDNFYTIYGNHDLPNNSYDLCYKSGVYTLYKAGKLHILHNQGHYDVKPKNYVTIAGVKILVLHDLVYHKERLPDEVHATNAVTLLKKYKKADIIITGHNHKTFVVKQGSRYLINAGSLTRHKKDQKEHKPCVFLYRNNRVREIKLPIETHVFKEDVKIESNVSADVTNLINSLSKLKVGNTFESTIKRYLAETNINKEVKNIINSYL